MGSFPSPVGTNGKLGGGPIRGGIPSRIRKRKASLLVLVVRHWGLPLKGHSKNRKVIICLQSVSSEKSSTDFIPTCGLEKHKMRHNLLAVIPQCGVLGTQEQI